jgi:hypothetical protein
LLAVDMTVNSECPGTKSSCFRCLYVQETIEWE